MIEIGVEPTASASRGTFVNSTAAFIDFNVRCWLMQCRKRVAAALLAAHKIRVVASKTMHDVVSIAIRTSSRNQARRGGCRRRSTVLIVRWKESAPS